MKRRHALPITVCAHLRIGMSKNKTLIKNDMQAHQVGKDGNKTLVSANHKRPLVVVGILCLLVAGRLSSRIAYAQSGPPSVTMTRPAKGETNVLRDVFVSADVSVPNGGIDPATLTASTVYLYPTSSSVPVSAVLNTSGGGDVIVLRPVSLLNANSNYTLVVTSGLK